MALFGLIKNKCTYCRSPIENGSEITAQVKVPGYVGTFDRKFCSEDHLKIYNEELRNRPKSKGGSCCG